MAKPAWKKFPHADKTFVYTGAALKKNWERLHCGDCEPFPADEAVQEAWRLYHHGEFQKACEAGLAAGLDGYNAANKATMIHATYLEDNGQRKLEMFQAISARCDELQRAQPKNANAHYFQAYALGRYSQGISVLKALTDGLGGRIKHFDTALKLTPDSAIACIEYANALVMLFGQGRMDEAVRLYEKAAAATPVEAMEYLDVELARSELED